MQVLYKSTRGKEETVTASMAILKGISGKNRIHLETYEFYMEIHDQESDAL